MISEAEFCQQDRYEICACCGTRKLASPVHFGCEYGMHSFSATHTWRSVVIRCWHCDYRRTVGTRRAIKNTAAALEAHRDLLALDEYKADLEAFQAYRSPS